MTRPWERLARAETAEGPLELRRRGETDYLITIDGRVLMSSMAHRSEDALARLACAEVQGRPAPRVLVSGLGLGYTLRAALDALPRSARVVVAELNAVVVEWCKGPLAPLTQGAANDPRVTLEVVDVAVRIAGVARLPASERFDAIILDMYEGPRTVVKPGDPLYGPAALNRTREALAPDGVLAIWCEETSVGFERALQSAGLRFEVHRAGHGGRVHVVYVAKAGKREQGWRAPVVPAAKRRR